MSFPVSVQKVETEIYETPPAGPNRVDTSYVLGATVDGVFVPFVTLAGQRVDDVVARSKAADKAAK